MAQVQVNFRCERSLLRAVEDGRGRMKRNAWLLEAVREKLARERLRGPEDRFIEAARARAFEMLGVQEPVKARAPRGCRVVGVSRAAQRLADASLLEPTVPEPLPGQIDLEEVLGDVA